MTMSTFTHAAAVSEGLALSLAFAERRIFLALADMVDLMDTPAIAFVGDVAGTASTILRHRMIQWGRHITMDATASETEDISATSVDGAYTDTTIARRGLRHDQSQLSQIIDGAWGINPEAIAEALLESFRAGRMKALGSVIAGASTNITSSGMGDVDDLFDIIDSFTADKNYDGPLFGMFKPPTKSSIRDSLRSEVGHLKERVDVQQFMAMGAEPLLSIMMWGSTHVTTAAGKYENAVMAPGAISYGVGSVDSVKTNYEATKPAGLPVVIDLEPTSSAANLKLTANAYDGQSIREQARIRGLLAATS